MSTFQQGLKNAILSFTHWQLPLFMQSPTVYQYFLKFIIFNVHSLGFSEKWVLNNFENPSLMFEWSFVLLQN